MNLTVGMPDELHAYLKSYADKEDRSMGYIMRKLIKQLRDDESQQEKELHGKNAHE